VENQNGVRPNDSKLFDGSHGIDVVESPTRPAVCGNI
jgi:hypothetical protein